jgi:hypothetical protein
MKKKIKKTHASKRATPKKKLAKKTAVLKKAGTKTKALKKVTAAKTTAAPKKPARRKSRSVDIEPFPLEKPGARSGGQSGDLQGLSDVEAADSESVDELLEEGNAFEADVVAGVERAGDDEKPVRTREVPEDDVSGEYLDEEQ